MSVTSDIYDEIVTRMTALFPNHQRLSHAYTPEESPEPQLRQGWALQHGSGENTNRKLGCKVSVRRQFIIIVTRKYYSHDSDPEAKALTDKDIIEDVRLIINNAESTPYLDGIVNNPNVRYVSDTGVQFVYANNKPFYKSEVLLEAEYFEDLN